LQQGYSIIEKQGSFDQEPVDMDATTGATVRYSASMAVDGQQVLASGLSFLTVHGESGCRVAEGEHAAYSSMPAASIEMFIYGTALGLNFRDR